jgi:hypothetical protein
MLRQLFFDNFGMALEYLLNFFFCAPLLIIP